jgi:ectoine hydroxylase-related dioxygenase (phytanoyl-CoA dioxygenase family)
MLLSAADITFFQSEGYVIVRGLFSPEEALVLRTAIETDGVLDQKVMAMKDAAGSFARLTLWHKIMPKTCYGAVAASTRMVSIVRALFAGVEPYHIHTKIILKEPRSGGAFDVHQDFGYWHACGPLDPNVMMSCIVAVDDADAANGCLHVLARSHRLGRLEHGSSGEQAGANPDMIAAARARLPTVVCELRTGDVLFTHSNLIHWSKANTSDRWRRAMIVAYNGVNNPPFERCHNLIPPPTPLVEVDDAALLRIGPVGHAAAAADGDSDPSFLSREKNVETFGRGKDYSTGANAATF